MTRDYPIYYKIYGFPHCYVDAIYRVCYITSYWTKGRNTQVKRMTIKRKDSNGKYSLTNEYGMQVKITEAQIAWLLVPVEKDPFETTEDK